MVQYPSVGVCESPGGVLLLLICPVCYFYLTCCEDIAVKSACTDLVLMI